MTTYKVPFFIDGEQKKTYLAPKWQNEPPSRVIENVKNEGFQETSPDASVSIQVLMNSTEYRGEAGQPTHYTIPGSGVNTTLNALKRLGVSL